MSGHEYLQRIKKELQAGRYQHKKGASILAAFGFVRRRQASLSVINEELQRLGLKCDPPIDENMPLDAPHIRFMLADAQTTAPTSEVIEPASPEEEQEESVDTTVTSFKVGELEAAQKDVETIEPTAPLNKAYTVMCLKKYSQLVVSSTEKPLAINIKGVVSYQSIANALLKGSARTVNECLDKEAPQVSIDDDIGTVIRHLQDHDVVVVIGRDKHLSGIVTAWDLAAEFSGLVGPFKWIGEIEARIKARLENKLGRDHILAFLSETRQPDSELSMDMLTMGSLHVLVQNQENWEKLDLPFDRKVFCEELEMARELRNRLMHFRDPPSQAETERLKRFCDVCREIA